MPVSAVGRAGYEQVVCADAVAVVTAPGLVPVKFPTEQLR